MISFTSAQLNAWLALYLWPFVRILAIVATHPVFGNRSIPARVKVGLAGILAILVAPGLDAPPAVEPGSAAGLLILAQQILIGTAIGFSVRIVFTAVEMVGELAGLGMGLGFATFYDPQNAGQTPIVAQFTSLLAILMFMAINGHQMVILALAESFHELPVGMGPLVSKAWYAVALWGGEIFRVGVWLSLPVVTALLVTNLSIGIMTRAAPQLNIFAVGFPITLMVGFFVLMLSLPLIMPLVGQLLQQGAGMMLNVPRLAR
jgi:flagellar biosynthetic protein FliR